MHGEADIAETVAAQIEAVVTDIGIQAAKTGMLASAAIIGSLPPAVALLIFVTSPDYMAPLFNDRRGHILLMIGGFWMTLGVLSMRKMINFKL